MKILFLALGLFSTIITSDAQTVDYTFIKSVALESDSAAIVLVRNAGYTPRQQGEYQLIKDNRIRSRIYYVPANPDGTPDQKNTYWAFQIRGKDEYSDIFKEIKKGAVKKEGTRSGKQKTEYKAKDGLYYYPFEDSSLNHLYWIYVSKGSILE